MLSIDNFYKVINIQILSQRKSLNYMYPLSFYKYHVYLNKDICHSKLYIYNSTFKIFLPGCNNIISRYIELYFPLEVVVGDYLCIVDNLPSEEDIWNLLSEVNDPELIKILTKMLLHEI